MIPLLAVVLSWQVEALDKAEGELRSGRPYQAFETVLDAALTLGVDGERALRILKEAQERMEASQGREARA